MYRQATRGVESVGSQGRRAVSPPHKRYGGYGYEEDEQEQEQEEKVGIRPPVPRGRGMTFDQRRDTYEEGSPLRHGRRTQYIYTDGQDQGHRAPSSSDTTSNRKHGRREPEERNSEQGRDGEYNPQLRSNRYRPPPREPSPRSQEEERYGERCRSPSYEEEENQYGPADPQDVDDGYAEDLRRYSGSPDRSTYYEEDESRRFAGRPVLSRQQAPDSDREDRPRETKGSDIFSDRALLGPDIRYSATLNDRPAPSLDQRRDSPSEMSQYGQSQGRYPPYSDGAPRYWYSSEPEQDDYDQDMPVHPWRHSSTRPSARDRSATAVYRSRTNSQQEETETPYDVDQGNQPSRRSVTARNRTQSPDPDEGVIYDDEIIEYNEYDQPSSRHGPHRMTRSPSASDRLQGASVDEYGYTRAPFQVTILEPSPAHYGFRPSKDRHPQRTGRSPSPSPLPLAGDQLQYAGVDEYGYTQAPFQVTIFEPTPVQHGTQVLKSQRSPRTARSPSHSLSASDQLQDTGIDEYGYTQAPSQVTIFEPAPAYQDNGHDGHGHQDEPTDEEYSIPKDRHRSREDPGSDGYRNVKRHRDRDHYKYPPYDDDHGYEARGGVDVSVLPLPVYHEPVPRQAVPKITPIKKIAELDSLRSLVVVPEAKVQRNKDRMIENGLSANAILDFLRPSKPEPKKGSVQNKFKPDSKLATKTTGRQPNLRRQNDPPFRKTFELLTSKSNANVMSAKSAGQVKDDWRKHRSIQNPKWYTTTATTTSNSNTSPSSSIIQKVPMVIAGESIIKQRVIYRALTDSGLELVDQDGKIQFTDLVLSPTTAVIFHALASLPTTDAALLKSVKRAAIYFQRIIVVFEVIPFRKRSIARGSEADQEKKAETNPLSDAVIKAIGAFKRAIALSVTPGEDDMIGTAEAVFAVNGIEEVARVMKHIAAQDDLEISARIKQIKGGKGVKGKWESKDWLQTVDIQDAEEEEVFLGAGFNLYSTRYLMGTFSHFDRFADEHSEAERLERAGPVVGTLVIERFNRVYKQRQIELEQMESTLYTSDPGDWGTRIHM